MNMHDSQLFGRQHGRFRRGDMKFLRLPDISSEEWKDRQGALNCLEKWAVDNAEISLYWYMRDKKFKRFGARVLRVFTICLTSVGGLVPIIGGIVSGIPLEWGYVLLAGAASCLGFDRFFGLSSGWLRDMQTVQALQRTLNQFYGAWVVVSLRRSMADDEADAEAVALISRLISDVGDLVSSETASWATEFNSAVSHIERLTSQSSEPTIR